MMEPMDGWETLSRIKSNPKTRHIPVLMFSAKKISPEEAEAHRIIIDDFLTKPVNPKKLLEAIEKVLARQGFNRRITDTWNAAGVSPEIIDEYLSLKTNLDVDVSLMAVMKKQLEMAYPDAINREDLMRSIVALEERIGISRARIDAFCHEQAGVLPAFDNGDPSPDPVTECRPALAQPVPPPTPSETLSEAPIIHDTESARTANIPVQPEPEDPPGPFEQKTSEPAVHTAEPVDVPESEEETFPAVTPPIPPVILPPTGPTVFQHVPEIVAHQGEQIISDPYPAEDDLPSPRVTESGDGKQKPDGKDPVSLFEPFGKTAVPSPLPQTLPAVGSREPVHTSRMNVSAGSGIATPAGPGSGTRTPDMRPQAMSNREQRRDEEDERESRTSSSGENIFSRIFSAIAGIFRRK
jgi:two-component system OmpR family response regulator